ncbi:MAG: sugar ABC transporter permease [Lachnospiraceae bacterium]|nr:sugar ABC transporter permease [Lachnospiraceae bacterium]
MAKKEKKTAEVSDVKETKEAKAKSQKAAASTADSAKKKKYTVEDILAGQGQMVDENGKKKKIKVKMKSKLRSREARWGYFFTFPWIIGAAVFLVYPIVMAVFWAFCERQNLGIYGVRYKALDTPFENFTNVFNKNLTLWSDLGTFLMKMVIAVPLITVFALLMALMLNTEIKGKGIYRTLFFLPVVIVSGPTMSMMTGASTDVISAVDMSTFTTLATTYLPGFLATAVSYVFENIILFLWYSGVQILIFISALQKMDPALYEAAKIDGGSSWECFWKITLPTLMPMILLNAIYTLISLSQDENISTLITSIKSAMLDATLGVNYASAFAIMYTIVVLLLAGVVALLLMPKKDVYDKQIKKNKKMEKRTRKQMAKTEKRVAKNAKKFEAAEAKKEKQIAELKAKGKYKEEEKGGRLDG